MNGLKFCTIIFLCCFYVIGFCQNSHPKLGRPYLDHYPPTVFQGHHQTFDAIQDSTGILYFANVQGIKSFDGAHWRTWAQIVTTAMTIKEDNQQIFAGGVNELGYLSIHPKDSFGTWISLKHLIKEEHQQFGPIWSITITSEGVLYQSNHYLFLWDYEKIQSWKFDERIFKTFAIHDKWFVLNVKKGLQHFSNGKFTLVENGEAMINTSLRKMLPYHDGKYLMVAKNGLSLFDGQRVEEFISPIDKLLETSAIYTAAKAITGEIVLACNERGLIVLDKHCNFKQIINEHSGLPTSSGLYQLFFDRANNLWLCSREGISRLDFHTPISIFDKTNGLDGIILDMELLGDDLYLASSNGLYRLRNPSYGEQAKPQLLFKNGSIKSLAKWNNQLFVAIERDRIYYLEDDQLKPFASTIQPIKIQQSKRDSNRLYVMTTNGIASFYNQNGTWTTEYNIDTLQTPYFIYDNPDGSFWAVNFANSVYHIQPQNNKAPIVTLFTEKDGLPQGGNIPEVYHLNGKVYFSFYNLYKNFRYDTKQNRFIPADKELQDFLQETRRVILASQMNTTGVLRYIAIDEDDVEYAYFSFWKGNQLIDKRYHRFNQKIEGFVVFTDLIDQNQVYWAGGRTGLFRYDLNIPKQSTRPFNAYIESTTLNEDSLIFLGQIAQHQHIEMLPVHQRIQFEVAALAYEQPSKNQYQYFLEGQDNNWSAWTSESKRTYTTLWEGNYVFKVRAKNVHGQLSPITSYTFTVKPPLHRTVYAYFVYWILGVLGIVGIVKIRSRKLKIEKAKLEQLVAERTVKIREQAKALKEMDEVKSQFFANVSHEFRTPLTLIKGPLDNHLKLGKSIESQEFDMMHRNANKLLRLVNQLLDISKIESAKLPLHTHKIDLYQFLSVTTASFNSLAEQQEITYQVESIPKGTTGYIDQEKIEKVLYNLLSNAMKFTDKRGHVQLKASIHEGENDQLLKLTISDTGKGIAPHELDKIFDRFYQVESGQTREFEGTGIGLALTKELIELHHGSIEVNSEIGKGSEFKISIPISRNHYMSEEVVSDQLEEQNHPQSSHETTFMLDNTPMPQSEESHDETLPLILIAEDNQDLAVFIHSCLPKHYRVQLAKDGQEALELSQKLIPDLIISDIMMPKMDGNQLCQAIKNEATTSHIPVVMLTAKNKLESKLEGLQHGADDYLTKPFNAQELSIRVDNLVQQRNLLRSKFSEQIRLEPTEITINDKDKVFLEKALQIVEDHIRDADFNVTQFQKEIGMSRMQLHRKLKALTDHSTTEFIRSIRIKRAAQILSQNPESISEVAYEVGFNAHSYFSKCFKQEFGLTPTEYVEQLIVSA